MAQRKLNRAKNTVNLILLSLGRGRTTVILSIAKAQISHGLHE
jgi:hypothetical protein